MLRSRCLARPLANSLSGTASTTAVATPAVVASTWASNPVRTLLSYGKDGAPEGPERIKGVDAEVIELEYYKFFEREPTEAEVLKFADNYNKEVATYRSKPETTPGFQYRSELNTKYTEGRDVLFSRYDNLDLPLTDAERDRLDELDLESAKAVLASMPEAEVAALNANRLPTDPLKRKEVDDKAQERKLKGLTKAETDKLVKAATDEVNRRKAWAAWVEKMRAHRVSVMEALPQVDEIEINYRTMKPTEKVKIPTVEELVAKWTERELKTEEDHAYDRYTEMLAKAVTPKQRERVAKFKEMIDRRFSPAEEPLEPKWDDLIAKSNTPWVIECEREQWRDLQKNKPPTTTADMWEAYEDEKILYMVQKKEERRHKRRVDVENQIIHDAIVPRKWWRDVTLEDELLQYPEIAEEIKEEIENHNWLY